jgi:hypothetical protein
MDEEQSMKIRRAFRFAFGTHDAGGKLIRGGFYSSLFFTVFFPFVVMGYLMRVFCDLLEGRGVEMPRWRNLRALFNDGLQPMLIALVYYAPAIVLFALERYIPSHLLWGLQAAVVLGASAFLPFAVLHAVVRGAIRGAFQFAVIGDFWRRNFGRVARTLGAYVGLGLLPPAVAAVVALLAAIPVSLLSNVGIGATTGLALGIVTFCFALFPVAVMGVHILAQLYRASTPFVDDPEGESRASVVMPPALDTGGK